MRALLPRPIDDPDVHGFFSSHWIEHGGLRANFIAGVDGAISVSGLSRGLQTPADNLIFAALRDLADAVIVGAGTARAERYAPVRPSGDRLAKRQRYGLPDMLPTVVVSQHLRLDPSDSLFAGSSPDAPTIVVTGAAGDATVRRALEATCDVIVWGDDQVDLGAVLADLRGRGLTRLLCEGGPTLFASLAGAGLIDELCLTISPLLAGPGSGRLTAGDAWPAPRDVRLLGLLTEDNALFGRYAVR